MSFFFFFSCSGSTCLFRRPRACCWLLHWTSPSLRTSSHSPCACARSPTAPTSPKNCARCASLSLSRVSTQRKKRKQKEKNDCTADRSSAFAATELWYVVFDTVVVSVVCFPEFLTLLSVLSFLVLSFSEFLMLLFFFLYAFAISCCFCLLYASCYHCCCCRRRRRFCCITRFRDLSSVVASKFSLFLLFFSSFCDLSKVVVANEKKL